MFNLLTILFSLFSADKKEICVVNPTILTKSIGATTNGTIKENNNVIINVVNGSHKQNGTAISNQR